MIMCDGDPSNPIKKPKPVIGWKESKHNIPSYIDRAVFPGLQGGPHNQTTAGITQALFEVNQPEWKVYAEQIVKNAQVLAEELMNAGLRVITGGTDNHLMLIDVTPFNISGSEAEIALEKAMITVNKNTIPFDPRSPFDPSGIRIGTPALTSRGMKEDEMKQIGQMIIEALKNNKDIEVLTKIKKQVKDLCDRFPLYPDLKY
jgi:glycine hydroxymethyltransferase